MPHFKKFVIESHRVMGHIAGLRVMKVYLTLSKDKFRVFALLAQVLS